MDCRVFYSDAFGLQDSALLDALCKHSEYKKVKKGTIILQEGDIQSEIPFLISGAFEGFFCDKDGKEIVDCLPADFGEPLVGASIFNMPSPVALKAVLPSEIICVPLDVIVALIKDYAEMNQLYVELSLKAVEKHREAKQMLYLRNSADRYQWFQEKYSNVADRLTQKKIAEFLGISEEWLSRVKHCNIKKHKKYKS